MSTKYHHKRLAIIEAFQMTRKRRWDNSEWPEWLNEAWQRKSYEINALYMSPYPSADMCDLVLNTIPGQAALDWNDWIIRGVKGELYPCKPSVFEATYEEVDK